MAKYNKELINKAANALSKRSKLMYCLYVLRIIKLRNIIAEDNMYYYGATANFKMNWFNPITYIYAIARLIYAITRDIFHSVLLHVKAIKYGILVYFE